MQAVERSIDNQLPVDGNTKAFVDEDRRIADVPGLQLGVDVRAEENVEGSCRFLFERKEDEAVANFRMDGRQAGTGIIDRTERILVAELAKSAVLRVERPEIGRAHV